MGPISGCVAEVLAARDARLLVGVAVGEEAAVAIDQQREALAADADAIDEAPQLLEPQRADEIARGAAGLIDAQR